MNDIKKWYLSKSIKFKIISAYILSLLIIGIVGYGYYVYTNVKSTNKEINFYRKKLIESQKTAVKSVVNIAMAGIKNYYEEYKSGKLTEKEAKAEAIKFIKSIRYNTFGNINSLDYVWLATSKGVMILDPARPDLENKNVLNMKDKNGVYLFKEMVRTIESEGSGFISYCWVKLDGDKNKCYPKISYIEYFYPWDWVVGSGFYLNDINKTIDSFASKTRRRIALTTLSSVILGGLISLLAALVFYNLISFVTKFLKRVGKISERLVQEEISPKLKLPVISHDEIGALVSHFNKFVDESYKVVIFKKTIEEDADINTVYKRLFDLIKDEFNIKLFNIFEVDNSKHYLKHITVYGDEKLMCKQEILINCSMCRAVRTAKEVDSFLEKEVCLSFNATGIKNHVCIPMLVSGSVGTVVQLIFDEKEKTKEIKGKVKRLKIFLKEAAPVIEAKRLLERLRESTLRDPLTGIYNRRFLDEFSPTFIATVKRRNTEAGILMIDIDFFKQVNDIYGHNVGDEVLKAVVRSISRSVREADIVVRFGGEEFIVLLQDINEKLVLEIAERIRSDVEKTDINIQGNIIRKTVSIGVSIFPKDSKNLWQCIKFSDVAMYSAKESGRNKVVRFEPSMWTEENY